MTVCILELKNPLEKTDFLFMMEQIVDMNQKINANDLNAESVIWDINYIFINEATRKLQFIYLPLEQNWQTVDVQMLVDYIWYSVKSVQGHDRNYISEFAYFLKGMVYKLIQGRKYEIYGSSRNRYWN